MASPVVLDPSPEHVAYALLGCFIIFFGLVSLFVKEKLFISEAFVSTAFGIIIGPYAIGIFDPMSWKNYDNVTLEFTRIVIAVQVMAAGVSLPRSYMVKEKRSLFMMIVPLMGLMWLTSATLMWGLIPDLDFVEAMVLAACVTPTDPVLSNSVVKGRFAEKHVPPRIRYLLSAESGINDGMGLPFLYLGLYLMRERTVSGAVAKWFYMIWAYQILLSVVLGGLIGAAARKLVKGAKNRNLIDKESFLVFSIALALAVAGCVSILASDDLLAVFIAGNVFAWDDWFSNEIAEAHIQEIIDMLLNLACFVYIGASIPFSKFHDLMLELSVWRLIVLAMAVLIFRRMPFVIAMKRFIPALATYREAAFAGWFGPIGVGAVYLSKVTTGMTNPATFADSDIAPYNAERLLRVRSVIFPVVMFLVFSSVLIHGVTVPLLHLQYKYTRTWSRKREESSHVVTRLPHINIGDEIVLRPPGTTGSSGAGAGFGVSGMMEGAVQASAPLTGGDLEQQRPVRYSGFGAAGVLGMQDLSRVSTINSIGNTNTRILENAVEEMKDTPRSKTVWSSSHAVDNGSGKGRARGKSGDSNRRYSADVDREGYGVMESMRLSDPASQRLNVRPSDIRTSISGLSGSSGHSSATVVSTTALQSPPAAFFHQEHPQQSQHEIVHDHDPGRDRRLSVSEFYEMERDEESRMTRITMYGTDERDIAQIERALEESREGQKEEIYS
ncbi:hypothetical protein BGZ99_008144 [Dissophora globulifera]|uniref:Cation/H+ exchanger transmembrane domain-containing protein n=1 Tax=Dissophora globulifera TaxID=979702 RepID=A0A9P6UPW5_9FUNG|nr:hypothetical protein BGZ99_008144 [Dissophora globulifera]